MCWTKWLVSLSAHLVYLVNSIIFVASKNKSTATSGMKSKMLISSSSSDDENNGGDNDDGTPLPGES